MFNFKVSLLYFLLILLSVFSLLTAIGTEEKVTIAKMDTELEKTPSMFRVHKELRELRLRDFAQKLALSEVGAVLELLHKKSEK